MRMPRHVASLLLVLLSAFSTPGGLCLCPECPGSAVVKAPAKAPTTCPCCCHGKSDAPAPAHDKDAPCPCCTKNAAVNDLLPIAAAAPERGQDLELFVLEESPGFAVVAVAPVIGPDVEPVGPPGRARSTVVLLL